MSIKFNNLYSSINYINTFIIHYLNVLLLQFNIETLFTMTYKVFLCFDIRSYWRICFIKYSYALIRYDDMPT